jgi:hypothetical protein
MKKVRCKLFPIVVATVVIFCTQLIAGQHVLPTNAGRAGPVAIGKYGLMCKSCPGMPGGDSMVQFEKTGKDV